MSVVDLAQAHRAALVREAEAALRGDDLDDNDRDIVPADDDDFSVDVDIDGVDGVDDGKAARAAADAAVGFFTSRLLGDAAHKSAVEALKARHGEDALLIALSAVVDGLTALVRAHSVDVDADLAVLVRSRAEARQLISVPTDVSERPRGAFGGVPTTTPPAAATTSPPGPARPRSTPPSPVAQALDSLIDGAAIADVDDGAAAVATLAGIVEGDRAVTALLRVRAVTAAAARSLAAVAASIRGSAGLRPIPHAPDEIVLCAGGVAADAVAGLLRAATSIASALPEGAPLSFALVSGSGDLVDDVVRAAALLPRTGLLALDETAAASQADLAFVPGAGHLVDPRAPYGHERWELSALLMRPPLVGRDDDIRLCADVFAPLDPDAQPRLLLLHGPPGIGKSSLVRAALNEAGLIDERAVLLWGAADPLQPTPYAAIVGMLRALARAPAGHPRGEARIARLFDGLANALPPRAAGELRALTSVALDLVVGVDDTDAGDVDAAGPRHLRTAIRRAVLLVTQALLARAGDDRPATFVVSGAEAMDGPTRETLAFVARRLGARARVVLLAAQKLKLPASFEAEFVVVRHEVKPLEQRAAQALTNALLDITPDASAGSVLEQRPLEDAVISLFERARGSPLFVAHAVRWAVEGGFLKKVTGVLGGSEWEVQKTSEGDNPLAGVPQRLDKLLHARVLRLPETERRVLGHCAALGLVFLPAAVEAVGVALGLSAGDIQRAVRLLTETGFLARSQRRPGAPVFVDDDAAGDDALLVFEHPLLRAAAATALHVDEANAVHGVVADTLEALYHTPALAPALARHHRLADRRRLALKHLEVAVRRARRLDDRPGAITMAKEGLDLCTADEIEQRFAFSRELVAVLEQGASPSTSTPSTSTQQTQLKAALKDLVRLAEQSGDPRHQATALARVARFNLFGGDFEKAEDAALKALERARAAHGVDVDAGSAAARGVRDVQRLLALTRFARRDLSGARRALDEAERLTGQHERRVRGAIEHQLGLFLLESNDTLGALEHLLRARGHKRAVGDLAGEAACLDVVADVYVRLGRLPAALALVDRALSLRKEMGDDAGHAQSEKNRADVLLLLGDVAGARLVAGRAKAAAKGLGLERLEHQAAIAVARADLAAEDADAAEAVLDNVRRRVDGKRDPFALMEAELLSGRAKWLRAQHAHGAPRDRLLKTALGRAQAAIEWGERKGFLSGQVLGNALLSDVFVASDDAGKALPYALRAVELLDDRAATALPVEDAFAAYARVLRAVGDDDEANSTVERARSVLTWRAAQLPPEWQERFWALPGRRELRVPPTADAQA